MKNYLPSKKFTKITLISIVIVGLFFLAVNIFSKKNYFRANNEKALEIQKLTINELIQKDSDKDGLADWEEALWGTDPNKKATFDDMPDTTYVSNKKKDLNIEQNKINEEDLTETDKLAREFFTAFVAMKASGQIDPEIINNFSNTLGQKIIDPNIIDIYSSKDIKIAKEDTQTTRKNFYDTIGKIFNKYKDQGVGTEIEIIGTGLTSSGPEQDSIGKDLLVIGQAYKDFSEEAKKVSVPESLSNYHLSIINSANNTGISVLNMSKVIKDPVLGISGLSQYEKYSKNLVEAVEELEAAL